MKKKGVLNFIFGKQEVIFYGVDGDTTIYKNLDEFLYADFGYDGCTIFMKIEELNALYFYLKDEIREGFQCDLLRLSFVNKVIGCSLYKKTTKQKHAPFKTFYDMHFKIGSDELEIEDTLKIIKETNFASANEGYTSKLRKEITLDENYCEKLANLIPSMTPIIYSAPLVEWVNVKCFDIVSAYPYLMTQPLPHFKKIVDFKEDMLADSTHCYYGGLEIYGVKAKKPYFPLTLIGKNDNGITIEKQGQNIVNRGKQLVSADKVVIYGFIKDLLEILNRNYDYKSYKIAKKAAKFELKIDNRLREKVLVYFETKQKKKRNGENYSGEKLLLNRLYGFLLTRGVDTPSHYGHYVISQERLIIDRIVAKIDFKDLVHCHTDSIKFVGDHEDVIAAYNETVEFEELGRFDLEDVFQKCVYYSHITAKYIDKKGKLGIKHGGISKVGIQNLFKMKYKDIDDKTKFALCKSFFYQKDEGYFMDWEYTDFSRSVDGG